MAGAVDSDDDMVVGRLNQAQDPTTLIGTNTDDGGWSGGPHESVFKVRPDAGESTGAILGTGGQGKAATSPSQPGGVGVQGDGGTYLGPGVVGRGSGSDDGRSGGTGVVGKGGSATAPQWPSAPVEPGPGVVGLGGRFDDRFNFDREYDGSGVVGLAGRAEPYGSGIVPDVMTTYGAGVYGEGGWYREETTVVNGAPTLSGPPDAGPGVYGLGGADGRMPELGAPGTVGVNGGLAGIPVGGAGGWSNGAGAIGYGMVGIVGVGTPNPRRQQTLLTRGGRMVAAHDDPQVQLVPSVSQEPIPNEQPWSATAIDPVLMAHRLPRDAEYGDFLMLSGPPDDGTGGINVANVATLFLCVQGAYPSGGTFAKWRPFLLGPTVEGRRETGK